MIAKLEWTQSNVQQNIEQLQSNNKQQINNNRTTAFEWTKPPEGSNAFYWHQIFILDSAAVEVQEMFSSHGGHLTNAMYHHGETLLSN